MTTNGTTVTTKGRPRTARVAAAQLAEEEFRDYHVHQGVLLDIANLPHGEFADAYGDGWTLEGRSLRADGAWRLNELRAQIRTDLGNIIAGAFRRGPSTITIEWSYADVAPAQGSIASLSGARQGLRVGAFTDDLASYAEWALLQLLIRDARRLRQCTYKRCGRFFVASRDGAKTWYCKSKSCADPRRTEMRKIQRRRQRGGQSPASLRGRRT